MSDERSKAYRASEELLGGVLDARLMFRMSGALHRMSIEAEIGNLSTADNETVWAQHMLVYAANHLHSVGWTQADFEHAVSEIVGEEWSTEADGSPLES